MFVFKWTVLFAFLAIALADAVTAEGESATGMSNLTSLVQLGTSDRDSFLRLRSPTGSGILRTLSFAFRSRSKTGVLVYQSIISTVRESGNQHHISAFLKDGNLETISVGDTLPAVTKKYKFGQFLDCRTHSLHLTFVRENVVQVVVDGALLHGKAVKRNTSETAASTRWNRSGDVFIGGVPRDVNMFNASFGKSTIHSWAVCLSNVTLDCNSLTAGLVNLPSVDECACNEKPEQVSELLQAEKGQSNDSLLMHAS